MKSSMKNFEANVAQLLTPAAASKTLSISPRKLWSLTASGEIRSLKIGRSVRYDRDDLREFIESQKQPQ